MTIFMQGYIAAQTGVVWWSNPYASGSREAFQWDAGHTRFRVYGGLASA